MFSFRYTSNVCKHKTILLLSYRMDQKIKPQTCSYRPNVDGFYRKKSKQGCVQSDKSCMLASCFFIPVLRNFVLEEFL